MSDVTTRQVLKITQTTLLKRRLAADADLDATEKVTKEPCRIYIQSYATSAPGEDLKEYYKVCFEAPFNDCVNWYVKKSDSLIEGVTPPSNPQTGPGQPYTGKTNQEGINLIKTFEGLRLEAYICPAGVPTIGYGTTSNVKMGNRITAEQAEAFLRSDLEKFETAVKKLVKVPLTANQFSALVSFTYNLGAGNLQKSTLLVLLNQGDYAGAAQEFLKWNKGGGKVLPGLTKRRQAEQALFLK